MKKIFICVFSIIIFSCSTFMIENNDLNNYDSNSAVLYFKISQNQDKSYLVYKNESNIWLESYNDISNTTKPFEKIFISNYIKNKELKFGAINNILFILNNNILSIYEIPINNSIRNIKEYDKINNVFNVQFYDNNCFYINSSGNIFVFNIEYNNFIQYTDLKLKNGVDTALIIKTEYIINSAREDTEQWFKSFLQRLIDKKINGSLNSNDEKLLFRRQYFKNYYSINNNKENEYNNFEDWYNKIFIELEKQHENKINQLNEKFKEKWGLFPNDKELLFSNDISVIISNKISIAKSIDCYKGKNKEIQLLIDTYNILLSNYSKLIDENVITRELTRFFEINYRNVSNEIIKKADQEKINYEIAKREHYEQRIPEINENFKNDLISLLNSIKLLSISNRNIDDEFGYIFLPKINDLDSYTVIHKNNINYNEADKFKTIGQDIKLFSIYDNNLNICENGKINKYNIFTLIKIENVFINTNDNEKVLFFIHQEKNVVITKKEYKSKRIEYFIKSIFKNRLININNYISNNNNNNNNNEDEYSRLDRLFFSEYKKFPKEYIYINVYKDINSEKTIINNNYIYRETPSGAGVIFQRSKP